MTKRTRPQSLHAIIHRLIDPSRTEYRGFTMRSRLEADFARYLDGRGVTWTYEPAIFGPRGSGYLPDFQIMRDDHDCFVEVKPTLEQAEAAKTRIEIVWESKPDALLVIVSAQDSRFFCAARGEAWTSWVDRWSHA